MGAWGEGVYDNDDAADWTAELREDGLNAIASALDAVVDSEYVESPEGARGVAAADVVARLRSGGGEETAYSAAAIEWVRANPQSPSSAFVAGALLVIDRVRSADDSELAELWAENPAGLQAWRATLLDVERRLSATPR